VNEEVSRDMTGEADGMNQRSDPPLQIKYTVIKD